MSNLAGTIAAQEALSPGAASLAERARAHVTKRLAPFLFLLYVLNYMDRVNISYASLQMTGDLGFSNAVFGFGAGIFFIGYFLFQIPGTILIEKWSARKVIGASLIVWGALATLTGFITNAQQFYWIRFFLGLAEAAFFPGVIVYLTHWYRARDRGKAVARFMVAIPISNMIGALMAAFLMRIAWLGRPGWRWLLVLEGLPSVIAGIVTFGYLTDRPKDAHWLPEDERRWLASEIDQEQAAKKSTTAQSPWQALRHPQVILFAIVYFCYITNSVGLSVWLPKIVQRVSGLSTFQVTLISAIPWLAAVPAMLMSAWHSDKTGERRWHAAIPILLVGVALALSQLAGDNLILAMAMFSLATMALYAFPSPFWALPTMFLSGTAAAASIALINSMGNLGGFVGPYVVGYLTDKTGAYAAGIYYLMASGIVGGLIVIALGVARPAKS
jgi:ACS family tartrate transporter-like MFS transporter